MTNDECERFQKAMDNRFDSIDPLEDGLTAHLEQCAECSEIFGLMDKLGRMNTQPEPSDAEFLSLRRGVLREIRKSDSAKPKGLMNLFQRPAFACAFSALLAITGFLVGKGVRPSPHIPEDNLVQQIQLAATGSQDPRDRERPPYLYENVKINDAGNGRIALDFDVSRHMSLTLPKNDPLVTDVLMRTLLDPSLVGTKLRAITFAGNDPKVRDGLIKVMLTDPNLGVRLKAQSRLIEQDTDPKVEEALLRVLQNEESVQMKLVAIEHLAIRKVDPSRIQRAIAPTDKPDAAYLKAMNYVNGGIS
jgi:hypothetical protein